jgi:hypothetical protein
MGRFVAEVRPGRSKQGRELTIGTQPYSMLSRLARLCRPHNICMFSGFLDDPPLE